MIQYFCIHCSSASINTATENRDRVHHDASGELVKQREVTQKSHRHSQSSNLFYIVFQSNE
jgi:hypothetical protein